MHLLVDVRNPYAPTGIPHLSPDLASLATADFLEWMAGPFEMDLILDSTSLATPPETFALQAVRRFEAARRFTELQYFNLGKALRVNEMFAGFNDIALLRSRASQALEQLEAMAAELEEIGIEIPESVFDHILTTFDETQAPRRDDGDHHDPR